MDLGLGVIGLYEINIKRIKQQSEYLITCLQVIKEVESSTKLVGRFAQMRALHIGVECMIDIGNTIIDGFIMRDPGGYLDIVDILEDEQVVSSNLANEMKRFVKFRELLVRYYDEVTAVELAPYVLSADIFREYAQSVDAFLAAEQAKGNLYASSEK